VYSRRDDAGTFVLNRHGYLDTVVLLFDT